MASIERTAYPRFKATLSTQELQTLYAPTEEEREFVATHARTAIQQLTLLTLLKCQQSLGYLPAFETIPPTSGSICASNSTCPLRPSSTRRRICARAIGTSFAAIWPSRPTPWWRPSGGAACHGGCLYHERPR